MPTAQVLSVKEHLQLLGSLPPKVYLILHNKFDVHGSVHLSNVYFRLRVQLDAHYMYSLFLYILLYLTVLKV
jgi:hypothetical protein